MECIDVKIDEELYDNNKSIGFINPPNDHHHDNKENEVHDEELEGTNTHSKEPSRHTQKNHYENQNIGDKSERVQTRRKLTEKFEQVHIVMLS